MPFLNGGHIWLILGLIILLVIFGPGKLPQLGSAVGQALREFRKATTELKDEVVKATAEKEAEAAAAPVAATPISSASPAPVPPVSAVAVEPVEHKPEHKPETTKA